MLMLVLEILLGMGLTISVALAAVVFALGAWVADYT
jgi:hypothetical protein